jgi:hypothetical protein
MKMRRNLRMKQSTQESKISSNRSNKPKKNIIKKNNRKKAMKAISLARVGLIVSPLMIYQKIK